MIDWCGLDEYTWGQLRSELELESSNFFYPNKLDQSIQPSNIDFSFSIMLEKWEKKWWLTQEMRKMILRNNWFIWFSPSLIRWLIFVLLIWIWRWWEPEMKTARKWWIGKLWKFMWFSSGDFQKLCNVKMGRGFVTISVILKFRVGWGRWFSSSL